MLRFFVYRVGEGEGAKEVRRREKKHQQNREKERRGGKERRRKTQIKMLKTGKIGILEVVSMRWSRG